MNGFNLTILEADSKFYEGTCESLMIPTPDGIYGVLAGHRNTVLAISTGVVKYKVVDEADFREASVSGGMARIDNEGVLILVDTAEHPEDIDINRAKRSAQRAREIMLSQKSIKEHALAEATLNRALNRLKLRGIDTGDPVS